jgi:hypothetical protein
VLVTMRLAAVLPVLLVVALSAGCAEVDPLSAAAPKPRIDIPTPLPDKFEVETPPSNLPQGIAAFSGVWMGDWMAPSQAPGTFGADHTLVIKRIEGTGPAYTAILIWSAGSAPDGFGMGEAGFWETRGSIAADGALHVQVPGPRGGQAAYRMSNDRRALAGEYQVGGQTLKGTLYRRLP